MSRVVDDRRQQDSNLISWDKLTDRSSCATPSGHADFCQLAFNLSVASSLATVLCTAYMTEPACRKDSIISRKRCASVAPEAVLLLSARNCRTKMSALSSSMRARLKMFTDQSSVNAREMKSFELNVGAVVTPAFDTLNQQVVHLQPIPASRPWYCQLSFEVKQRKSCRKLFGLPSTSDRRTVHAIDKPDAARASHTIEWSEQRPDTSNTSNEHHNVL